VAGLLEVFETELLSVLEEGNEEGGHVGGEGVQLVVLKMELCC